MQRFDCLAVECPIFGAHLLEASAGTGKTFSIEHIFIRLLLEQAAQSKQKSIQLEEILVVTFTKAATRELKERIRASLAKAIVYLEKQERIWPYLVPFFGSVQALQLLKSTLAVFDKAQIFTIHGFCFRMLQEFCFEAGLGFGLKNPDRETAIEQEIRRPVIEFLSGKLPLELLCPEQMALLFGTYDAIDAIALKIRRSPSLSGRCFSVLSQEFAKQLQTWKGAPISKGALQEDFIALRDQYKAQIKGDFTGQLEGLALALEALAQGESGAFQVQSRLAFKRLIRGKGSLLRFCSPYNKKVRAKEIASLSYPGFFDWATSSLGPLVEEAIHPKKILGCLAQGWRDYERKSVSLASDLSPDEILRRMRLSIDLPQFVLRVKEKFKAVIIDEFQDTDPLQWDIFQRLFLTEEESLQAIYFVGDPKQSIYRFRNADVYTYIAARELLGAERLYHLDTNFRSSEELLNALNVLFHRNWLALPKIQSSIPYHPVKAGLSLSSELPDRKRALQWIVSEKGARFETTFLPFAVQEIERLSASLPLHSFAILVRNRYEASQAVDLLQRRGIQAMARSHEPIGKTFAFLSLRELIGAVQFLEERGRKNVVAAGPFAEIKDSLSDLRALLEKKGLAPFFSRLPYPKDNDLRQVFEELFAWEQREGFSFEGLDRFLDRLEQLTPEEGAQRKREGAQDAVQVLTLHVSKGLEFDVVFALGLISSMSEDEEDVSEAEAESLRQLYVAMTRAKKRLYVPFIASDEASPMHLLAKEIERQEGSFLPYLESLEQRKLLSVTHVPPLFPLPPALNTKKGVHLQKEEPLFIPPFAPCLIQSFTSLAIKEEGRFYRSQEKSSEEISIKTLPRGAEIGVVVHTIFEQIFRSQQAVWRDRQSVALIVERQTKGTSFAPWKEPILEMVWDSLEQNLSDGIRNFRLQDLDPKSLFVEMEFLFPHPPHFIKGFIDLAFCIENTYYFLDWKTNFLEEPTQECAQEEMKRHSYDLQAALYAESYVRYLGDRASHFGGAFYFFVRSCICLHLYPNRIKLESYG